MAERAKDLAAADVARLGGRARAERLTEEQRREIGRRGAEARWRNKAEAAAQQVSKVERRVDALIASFVAGTAARCTFIMRQGEIWTTDPEGDEFKRFMKHAPRCIVGTYDRSVTREAVMQDVDEVRRESHR